MLSCGQKTEGDVEHGEKKIVTVQKKPNIEQFFYNGEIKPLKVEGIISPEEGRVISTNFNYGQAVVVKQPVLTISSEKLQMTFHDSITNYLKAKDSYLNNVTSFEGAKELYHDQIISRQEFTNEKSQFENSQLGFLDAKFKLEKVIKMIPGINSSIVDLTLKDLPEVTKLFKKQFEHIQLHASRPGIVLFPVKTATTTEEGDKEIVVGSEVKKGQVLVSIGDMEGISVEFDVNEAEINRIKAGLKAIITSSSIEDMRLEGKIVAVGVQAKRSGSTAESAIFPVRVEVEKIPPDVLKRIRVGMTAKVEVDIVGEPVLMVPLKAVRSKESKQFVLVSDPKTKKPQERVVQSGRTTLQDVIIKNGLKEGEQVIVYD